MRGLGRGLMIVGVIAVIGGIGTSLWRASEAEEQAAAEQRLEGLVRKARASYRVGRIADAERELREVLERQRALGGDSADVAASIGLYGSLQTVQGRHQRAIPLLEEADRMAAKFATPGSAVHLQNRTFLAEAHAAAGQHRRAADIMAETLAMARTRYGESHLHTQRARLSQAKVATAHKSHDQSLVELTEVTDNLRNAGTAAHLPLAQALVARGELLMKQKRATEALPLLEEAVRLREQLLWEQSWELAEARARLGEAQLATGTADGRQLIEDSLATLETQLGPEHHQAKRAKRAIEM